jgi:hypothetical protein
VTTAPTGALAAQQPDRPASLTASPLTGWPRHLWRRTPFLVAMALTLMTSVTVFAAAPAKPRTAVRPKRAASAPALADSAAVRHRVIAYYFHTSYRCANCRKIEAYSHEAIEAAFPQELKDGHLAWQLVNVQEKDNEHFIKDYQLYTKSLVLVDEVNGKQVRWKNLAKVWEFLQDRDAFLRYVQDEVRSYLTKRS